MISYGGKNFIFHAISMSRLANPESEITIFFFKLPRDNTISNFPTTSSPHGPPWCLDFFPPSNFSKSRMRVPPSISRRWWKVSESWISRIHFPYSLSLFPSVSNCKWSTECRRTNRVFYLSPFFSFSLLLDSSLRYAASACWSCCKSAGNSGGM